MMRKKGSRVELNVLEAAVDAYNTSGTLKNVAKTFGVAVDTLRKAVARFERSGNCEHDPPRCRSGPKRVLNEDCTEVKSAVKQCRSDFFSIFGSYLTNIQQSTSGS